MSFNGNGTGLIFGLSGIGGYGFYVRSFGALELGKFGDSITQPISPTLITNTDWHHVAVTKSNTTVVFYVDGVAYPAPPYAGGPYTFSAPGYIGAWAGISGQVDNSFYGMIDELSIYNRALSVAEIQAAFNAGGSGKCTSPTPPFIITPPANQSVIVGSNTAFSIVAGGTAPLGYQWRFAGTNISGATSSSLALVNVQFSQAGSYSVVVTNAGGTTNSSDAVLTVNPPPPCVTPPTGLVSWWRGEGNANDSVGDIHGALYNGTTFTAGMVGQALNFDGINDSVTNRMHGLTNIVDSFTIEFWAYPTAARAVTPEATSGVAGNSNQRYAIYPHYRATARVGTGVSVGTNGVSVFEHSDTYLPSVLVYNAPIVGWTHISVVYSNRQPRLYLNGNLVRVGLTSTRFPYPSTWLGEAGPISANYGPYAGRLDEVSIYDRTLSAAEVQALFNAGGSGKCKEPPSISVQPVSQRVTIGSNVTFSVTAAGAPQLRYQWTGSSPIPGATNASLSFIVQPNSGGNYSVRVTNAFGAVISSNAVLTVNTVPVADASATLPLVISPNNSNVTVVLDGSLSSDADGDLLQYRWYATGGTNAIGTGVVAVVTLPAGSNSITLVVNDGLATGSQTIRVEVITAAQAVARLALSVQASVDRDRPLIASLQAAIAAIDRNNPTAAINQLQAFQNKVRAQVTPLDAALAEELIAAAQAIIDELSGTGPSNGRITAITKHPNGIVTVEFTAQRGRVMIVEASTDTVHWEKIGVAADRGNGTFDFEDAKASQSGARFYRIVTP